MPDDPVIGPVSHPESILSILDVVYLHQRTSDGGDLYLTRFGVPHADLLAVENWFDPEWFAARRHRLEGTSAVYRVPTKEVAGRSLDLVVKNCRVGEDVPVATHTLQEFVEAEFNSPWEEFALVNELREGRYGPPGLAIRTQVPLAIYVPPERMQVWQTGRSLDKIARIQARHPGVALDVLKQYKLVYGWIHGLNVVEALLELGLPRERILAEAALLAKAATADLDAKGYAVADMKPVHVIIADDDLAAWRRDAAGDVERGVTALHALVANHQYSVIDYELLLRTAPHEQEVAHERRHGYLAAVRDRMVPTRLPGHLAAREIFGVPYVTGHVESTNGRLWVVGRNGRLFDYFLPERWRRTPSVRLSANNEVFYTQTKDRIHLVWKTSRVGELPGPMADETRLARIARRGFNSPFEVAAIAQHLNRHGVATVYLRAIYMTGSLKMEESPDRRRHDDHAGWRDPEGQPILRLDRNYITVRGFFNGPDAWVAEHGSDALCRPLDLARAVATGEIDEAQAAALHAEVLAGCARAGLDASLLERNDLLLSLAPDGSLVRDADDRIDLRICNLELIHPLTGTLESLLAR